MLANAKKYYKCCYYDFHINPFTYLTKFNKSMGCWQELYFEDIMVKNVSLDSKLLSSPRYFW